ncbi:hypothetical protein C8Q79DRAFT_585735 [Trametes meyenii]|nr:hypothetical protein C8Q79DRAFT_585735 [Trametes meyenii]
MSLQIVLSNSAIPVEVNKVEDLSATVNDRWVVQRNLRNFFASRGTPPGTHVSSTLKEPSAALLLFKLSFTALETAIGVSWHHTLGDAVVLQRFMRGLSCLYQGNDLGEELKPSFIKREFSPPSESLIERYLPLMQHLATTYSYAELGKRYAEKNENAAWVRFKISVEHLRQLRGNIKEATGREVSIQDILTAYIVRIFNRCLDTQIAIVTNVASIVPECSRAGRRPKSGWKCYIRYPHCVVYRPRPSQSPRYCIRYPPVDCAMQASYLRRRVHDCCKHFDGESCK